MAERLAPQAVQIRITSRPERPRSVSHWVRRVVAALLGCAVLLAAAVLAGHTLAIQRSAVEIRATSLVAPGMPATVLVVMARPGQELAMAGTLAALDAAGADVTLLALTAGEAQPPQLPSPVERIAAIRAEELARSAQRLGVDRVLPARFADGEVLLADPAEVTGRIDAAIERVAPSAVITVADGSGEDPDSQAVAAYTVAAAQAAGSVSRVWTVTRGDAEVRWNALLGAGQAAAVLPTPQVAVRIGAAIPAKSAAITAHGTQSPDLVQAAYPLSDRLPGWAYFRFWDREYFALAWGLPIG